MFLFHYGQMGSNRGNRQLPINILKRGPITNCAISYGQHKNFCDFFSEQIVGDFLSSVTTDLIQIENIRYKDMLK